MVGKPVICDIIYDKTLEDVHTDDKEEEEDVSEVADVEDGMPMKMIQHDVQKMSKKYVIHYFDNEADNESEHY